jgi:hypothetical protein
MEPEGRAVRVAIATQDHAATVGAHERTPGVTATDGAWACAPVRKPRKAALDQGGTGGTGERDNQEQESSHGYSSGMKRLPGAP